MATLLAASLLHAAGAEDPVRALIVPHCQDGLGSAAPYYLTDSDGLLTPHDATSTLLCWNETGISISTNNTDQDIWQTCDYCGCENFGQGDVAEAFLGPVSSFDRAPSWYLEMDVGAVTGAFWGGIVHNSKGDDALYPAAVNCSAEPDHAGGIASCHMDCTGELPRILYEAGEGWWSRAMLVPWSLYRHEFTPAGTGTGAPWPTWRGNFYRYSYPFRFDNGTFDRETFELSGWTSTHSPSFHEPTRFGLLTFRPRAMYV